MNAKHDPFELEMFTKVNSKPLVSLSEPIENEIILPVLDRFMTLLATLKDPSLVKNSSNLRSRFLEELTLIYGPSVPVSLVENNEFMLRFQLVSLAKNHNFFGKMDNYMKEFSRIVLGLGDSQITRGLEKALNAEVSLKKEQSKSIGDYQSYNREVDHGIL